MIESVSESLTVFSDSIDKRSIRVLHVDSDPSFLKVAKQILEMNDQLEVEMACSVEEAQRKIKEKNYDAIISDYQFQGKDGSQFLKELKSQANHIPFIVFAGGSREETAMGALSLGANNYVNKHDNPEKAYTELVHDILDAVGASKAREALKKSEETLRLALNASRAGVWNYDFREKRTTWSRELFGLYGLEPGSLEPTRKNWMNCVHPDDRDKVNEDVTQAIKSRRYLANEYRIVWPDGTVHWMNDKGKAFFDGNGMPLRMTGISIDVTEYKKREEESRRLAFIVESSDDAIIGKSLDGTIVSWNTGAQRIYGYTSEEVVGKSISIIVPPELQEEIAVILKKIQQGEKVDHYETRRTTKDQKKIWVSLSISSIRDANGIIIGASTIARDITDRKLKEQELRESERKYRAIFEGSNDGIIIVESITHRIVFVNPAICRLTRCREEELLKLKIEDIHPKEALPFVLKQLETVSKGNIPRAEAIPVLRKDGRLIYCHINASMLKTEKQSLVVAVFRDVTETRETERLILESRQRFAALFIGNPEATVYADQGFHIIDINPRFESLFGYSLDEVKGKSLNDVVVPEELLEESKNLEKKAGEGYAYRDTIRKRKNGTLVSVSVSASPVFIQNKSTGYIAVYKDISEQMNSQKKLSLTNEKLHVVGGLTRHDIRNKMSAIVGNAYLAKKELAGNDKALHYLKEIERAVQQSVSIFEFAKTYEMLGVEKLTYIDVGQALKDAASLVTDLKHVALTDDCHGLTVLADSLLQQLFYNLIDNSLKHGERTRRIKVSYKKTGGGDLKLIYEDDGVGIPASQKTKLFNEGYSTGGSTGYGLYLIKKMTETYGWTINETGEPGKGARFVIQIPKRKFGWKRKS